MRVQQQPCLYRTSPCRNKVRVFARSGGHELNPSHSSAAAKYRGLCETLYQHFGACWPTSRQHVVQNFRVRQGKPGVGHRRRRRRLRSVHHDSLRQASEAGLATGVVQGSRALVAYREHATTGRMVMMIELPKYILSSSTAGLMRRSTC